MFFRKIDASFKRANREEFYLFFYTCANIHFPLVTHACNRQECFQTLYRKITLDSAKWAIYILNET